MKRLVIYDDDGGEREIPHKWEICSYCRGDGTSSAYLGAFTRDDWDQMDTEWQEDYIAGRFDRACPHCEGGKVRVPDYSRMSKADKKAWRAQERAAYEVEQEEACERRMLYGLERGY
jgi:hypothetical protein